MIEQKAWTPDQPLRADATDEQIRARFNWRTIRRKEMGSPLLPASTAVACAREFATVSVEAVGKPDPARYDQPTNGCWVACIAGLTGIPLDELAPLIPAADEGDYEALSRRGAEYHNAVIAKMHAHGWTLAYLGTRVPAGYSIASGQSPRGILHAVIAKDGVLWHDPHESRAGCEIKEYEVVLRLAAVTACYTNPKPEKTDD